VGFSFFVLGWTWGLWSAPVLTGSDPWTWPGAAFLYAGGAGPLVGGLLFTAVGRGRAGLAELGARLVDPRRIGPRWWLAVLGLVPAVELIAALLAASGAGTPLASVFAPLRAHLAAPANLAGLAAFTLLLGPLPEEIGWRGYALDALQARHRPLVASLLLAAVWIAWHAPLFFMNGYYARFGGSPAPLWFAFDLLLTTLLMTWIHDHTRGSLLAAVLFHFATNFTGELIASTPTGDRVATGLTTAVVASVVASGGLRPAAR
jgi:membrane protease YdiL (CAAX protease family)